MSKKPVSSTAKRLILVVNQKGGVGKSVVSRALVDALRSAGITVSAYDADGSVGSLLQTYGTYDDAGNLMETQDPSVGVGYYDIRNDSSRHTLLDSLGSGAKTIIHDLAGGSLAEIKRIVDDGEGVEGFLAAVEEQGYRITLVHVLSNVSGATSSVGEYLAAFGDQADHVAVVNKAWGRETADFPFWYGYTKPDGSTEGGKTRASLLSGAGVEIHFPALQPGTFAKVEADNARYSAAAESPDLSITERAHLSKFVRTSAAAFAEAGKKLGF